MRWPRDLLSVSTPGNAQARTVTRQDLLVSRRPGFTV
jgi:hypothetical protein